MMSQHRCTTPVLILAGGEGSRMGGVDKCLLQVGTLPVLARICKTLGRQNSDIVLNANGDSARFAAYGLPVLADKRRPPVGPLGGIAAMMQYLAGRDAGTGHFISVAGDCPFIPTNLISTLHAVQRDSGAAIVYCRSGTRDHFVMALWSLTLSPTLRQFLDTGRRSVGEFIHSQHFAVATFSDQPFDPFFNINTQAQWEVAQTLASHIDGVSHDGN